jgi:hypothetical protein
LVAHLHFTKAQSQSKNAKELPSKRTKTPQQWTDNNTTEKERHPLTAVLPQWGLKCFYDSLVLNRSIVLQLNFSAKNPPLRQAEKRYVQFAIDFLKAHTLKIN